MAFKMCKQMVTAVSAASVGLMLLMTPQYAGASPIADSSKKEKAAPQKETAYEKLFKKEHQVEKGMITLHLLDGKVYFEFPLKLVGREMIMGSTIKSISDNANGVVGVKPSELRHIMFTKVDSTMQLRSVNTEYIADDENIQRALSKSMQGPVLRNMPVKAYSPDSSAVVFDVTDIFLSHDKKMSPFSEFAAYAQFERKETFQKDLSFIAGIKAFEDNVSVTSSMTYTYNMEYLGQKLLKDEPLTAELTRSIVLLPEEIYHPRMADYRIGVFFTPRTQMGTTAASSRTVYFANRWRMEPSDTAAYRRGELVEPVKPIIFYIDNDFPEWWKPYLKEGVEQWQELFEEIGFKNAIQARFFPTPEEDPEFDPENIKYNCIRYEPIGIQNAMGPSWVDPRSGEIINAAVYVYHDIVKLITRWMFVQTSQTDPAVRTPELPQEMLGDAVRYVLSHEVGHTLGFMHNMSGSSVIPVESLRDPEFTRENGTTTSIMDYARFNYVAQPGDKERGVKLTPPRFGTYDKWLIRWTYTPVFDVDSFEEEAAITSQWITDAVAENPVYRYGKQQMTPMLYDPRCQVEDLGDDAVKATQYGVSNLKYITHRFMDWVKDEQDEDYEFRTSIFNAIINQFSGYCQHVLLNVGGLYKNEIKAGDQLPKYENIPASKQKEALEYMFTLWEDLDWLSDPEVVGRLPIVGSPEYAVRDMIQGLILMAPGFCSMSDGVASKEFSFTDCIDMIYDHVWAPTQKKKKLTDAQKQFQKAFVYHFMQMGNFKIPGASKNSITSLKEVVDISRMGGQPAPQLGGSLLYNPVSGYEWFPRTIFNQGDMSQIDCYSYLAKTLKLLESRVSKAADEDKVHYQLLIRAIRYGLY